MFRKYIFYLAIVISTVSCGTSRSLKHLPEISQYPLEIPVVVKKNDSVFLFKKNSFAKNKWGIWELYAEGNPLQIGYNSGALSQKMMQKQEDVFFSKVKELVPSNSRQKLLSKFLKWYNRKMYLNVRNDFQTEIYGLSQYSSDVYDWVAPKFQRSMYLHAAHDIGHAMQDLMMVGCSSMAVWNDNSENGELLIGRNFDFYAGDNFAKEKVVQFIKPEKGIPYMSYSWPGMTGVVSGMNLEGITVTINAGKSKIPLVAKTPVSLVTKEILMFAKNIDEAIEIAKKRKVFVSESIMVGSASDKKAVLIEISPKNFGVYDVPNSDKVICTNHFQSESYKNDRRNIKQFSESHSKYRYEKLQEILAENKKMNPQKMVEALRNTSGLNHSQIGYGNEKAINQLLGHHGIVFSPEKRLVWVSTKPFQLGEFVCYDLNEIFSGNVAAGNFSNGKLNIHRDSFADSDDFKNYQKFRIADREIDDAIKHKKSLSEDFINKYRNLNPELWIVHFKTGKYYFQTKNFVEAKKSFETALTKEISTVPEKENIESYLKKTNRKLR